MTTPLRSRMGTDELDELKSDPRVLELYGQETKLKKSSNKSYVGICPLPGHSEKTPSFNVFDDMRFHCYGCGLNGNIFQFLEAVHHIDFNNAVKIVKNKLDKTTDWEKTKRTVEETFKPVVESKTFKTVPLSAWIRLETALANSTAACDFLLKERGIPLVVAQQLRLGFVQDIGKLAGEDGQDIANKGWIVFPAISDGQIVSIKFRSIVRKKPGGFSREPGMASALFNTETIDCFEPVYLVEGEIDCLTLENVGLHSVSVPSAGTKLTPSMKDQLKEASYVILAGDTDSTGLGYMNKLWRE